MKVIGDIYSIPGILYDSNCYLIGKDELTLIDCGTGLNIKYLLENIKDFGLNPDNIIRIILTHAHFDHSGGLNELSKIIKAELNVFHLEATFIEKADKNMLLLDLFGSSFSPVKVDIKLKDNQLLRIGNYDFEIIHTPGHSPGSICLYEKDNQILISGDTVFSGGSFGRFDLPGGNINELASSIKKLSRFNVKYILPGHDRISRNGNNDIKSVLDILTNYY
jgi:hydroxyacylglutathione hydrolase